MAISGVGQNYAYLEMTTNSMQRKTTVREAIPKMAKQSINFSISDEGKNMLREMVSKIEPASDYINAKELTIQNTNEVAWEHYTAMRSISSLTLEDGNYNAEDIMKSIMDTYETRYHEIVKAHENGDRDVAYELTGKSSLTLAEDLAGLDEAYKMRMANLKGYIFVSRQIGYLKIRTVHGISIETVHKSETFLSPYSYYLQKTGFLIFDRGVAEG